MYIYIFFLVILSLYMVSANDGNRNVVFKPCIREFGRLSFPLLLFLSIFCYSTPPFVPLCRFFLAWYSCKKLCRENKHIETEYILPFLPWSCNDHCHYGCMWMAEDIHRAFIANKANSEDYKPKKFEGRWPFYRLWGIQEPASAIFSIANSLPFAYYFLKNMFWF